MQYVKDSKTRNIKNIYIYICIYIYKIYKQLNKTINQKQKKKTVPHHTLHDHYIKNGTTWTTRLGYPITLFHQTTPRGIPVI